MIRLSKYTWAYIIAMMGILLIQVEGGAILTFFGGFFVGKAIQIARESGEEEKNYFDN